MVEDLTEGRHCCIERSSRRPSPLRHFTSDVIASIAVSSEASREYSDPNLVVEPPLFRR
jgi:hypothetical protein